MADYLQSLKGFDPKRDYGKYAKPEAQSGPGYSPELNYAQDSRNDAYAERQGYSNPGGTGPVNTNQDRQPKSQRSFDINTMAEHYDDLDKLEQAGVDVKDPDKYRKADPELWMRITGSQQFLADQLYKVQQDYQQRLHKTGKLGPNDVMSEASPADTMRVR